MFYFLNFASILFSAVGMYYFHIMEQKRKVIFREKEMMLEAIRSLQVYLSWAKRAFFFFISQHPGL